MRERTPDDLEQPIYDLSNAAKNAIQDLKYKYQFEFLLQDVYILQRDYEKLGRSSHNEKIDNLISELEKLQNNVQMSYLDKLRASLDYIATAFKQQMKQHRSNRLFFSSAESLLEKIEESNTHHFPRMLALIYNKALADPNATNVRNYSPGESHEKYTNEIDPIAVIMKKVKVLPDHPAYERFVHSTLDQTHKDRFAGFCQQLANSGLSKVKLYRLYTDHDQISSVADIRNTWPELRALRLSDDAVQKLLHAQEINGFLQSVAGNERARLSRSRISETLAKIIGSIRIIQAKNPRLQHNRASHSARA